MNDCDRHLALIASGEARDMCPLCQADEIERLQAALLNDARIKMKFSEKEAEIKRLRAVLTKPITMQDVRLHAGEGQLDMPTMLAAANAVLRQRAGQSAKPSIMDIDSDVAD